jgi:UDP-N-acetylmuramoyl-L-alanyl-D-glutamate--2,6-diaminopimelate ligase
MTMPGRFFMQKFLADALRADCDVAILEVTSEGIRQSRHSFIHFDAAALTNVTPEHIESHGGFDKYRAAKLKLFRALARSPKKGKTMVINGDDASAKLFLQYDHADPWIYALQEGEWAPLGHTVIPQRTRADNAGIFFVHNGLDFHSKLKGEFNIYNTLCAYAIALSRGIDPKCVREALEGIEGVPGRVEYIAKPPGSVFSVIVDYAHTPDALLNVYKTLKPQNQNKGKLICVFGSTGGGRDKWKRPEMGSVAESWCDEIILTDDDPYDENSEAICVDIARGIKNKKPEIITDRKMAITRALRMAGPDDVVIITGKGSESVMVRESGKRIPWDDREIVRSILREGE